MSSVRDLTGQRFGRLVVVSRGSGPTGNGAYWDCLCDCGGRKTVISRRLTGGLVLSCGCARAELAETMAHARSAQGDLLWRRIWDRTCKRCELPFKGTAREEYCCPCKPLRAAERIASRKQQTEDMT